MRRGLRGLVKITVDVRRPQGRRFLDPEGNPATGAVSPASAGMRTALMTWGSTRPRRTLRRIWSTTTAATRVGLGTRLSAAWQLSQ